MTIDDGFEAFLHDLLGVFCALLAAIFGLLALLIAGLGSVEAAFPILIIGGLFAQRAVSLTNRADSLHERARAAERIETGEDDYLAEAA